MRSRSGTVRCAIGQFNMDSREIERVVFDRELRIAICNEVRERAVPVEGVKQFDALAPDLAHLEGQEIEEAGLISRQPQRNRMRGEGIGPGGERGQANFAMDRAVINPRLAAQTIARNP